ncbi:hypothetical protein B0H63DRAFT_507502 [Podospora didyma]|uniref:Ankyrin repeat protein n=1 Tax=Podospora didyma TaxID=330526 RepID=A0AAE0NYM8_9PEZI|nr:hypothetical protein B0H63DRAFT_507502 [Podospora didyma]
MAHVENVRYALSKWPKRFTSVAANTSTIYPRQAPSPSGFLTVAVARGNHAMVRILLDEERHYAQICNPQMMEVLRCGRAELVKHLVMIDLDVNAGTDCYIGNGFPRSVTPLYLASRFPTGAPAVSALIELGARDLSVEPSAPATEHKASPNQREVSDVTFHRSDGAAKELSEAEKA